jgi:3-methyl-2-oxobutanoate hydroxymethyltransferase
MSIHKEVKKVTTNTLHKMKENGEKISMLTAYDFSFAKIFDTAGIDVLLVGDSAGNVIAGYETTLPVTLDQIIYHAQCGVRGVNRSLVVVDMPFGTYQSNSDIALASAIRIMKETGGHSVKMEGGEEILDSIQKIVSAGIPVMGHLGLTPQSIYKFGTYTVRAKEELEADKLRKDIKLLEEAGCFAVVLEKIPAALAKEVTASVSILL